MPKKIYALLVGITEYNETIALDNSQVIFPQLAGCVNDLHKVKDFLERNYKEDDRVLKILCNEEATKENISNGFLQHLAQAGEEDSVLFYFSGHGTQEFADPCFSSETDGRLEALVCYFNENTAGNCLMADKELRYLIGQVARNKPHITIIADCCHSGDLTRNLEMVKINFDVPVEKKSKGTYTFGQRNWNNFIFHEQFTPEDIKNKGLNALLPEGSHIFFSASESHESAFEINGEGIFTKHLIDILQTTNGSVSNQMLFDRLSMCMKYAYVQKPRLYMPVDAEGLKSTGFLNIAGFLSDGIATAYYNPEKGWILNRGEISGIYEGLEIDLYDVNDKSHAIKATVQTPAIDHAILHLTNEADTNKAYTANVDYLARKTIRLHMVLEDAIPRDAAALINVINSITSCKIELVAEESAADYTLHHLAGRYYLTRKYDRYRPISAVTACPDFKELTDQLEHLSQWEFINQLSKTNTPADQERYLGIEYALGNSEYKPLPKNGGVPEIKIDTWPESSDEYTTDLKVRLTNKTSNELYVSVLYLDVNFASESFLLEPSPYHLVAGASVELNVEGDADLPVQLYKQALYFNYEQYIESFKIIVSDKPFEIHPLMLPALPEPPLPGVERERNIRSRGGIGRTKSLEGWFVTTVQIINVNPSFNKISSGRLQEMLSDELTARFAEELFFTLQSGSNPLVQDVVLKPGIVITGNPPDEAGKRSVDIIVDVANWWARKKRNRYYEDITRRYPQRTKIVAEGDSWFQHPFIYDIIDDLSKVYAVRCVAAETDSLKNYFSDAQKQGDYYLNVLTEVNPAFFLISGGGNDIFGSSFREFLVANPYEKKLKGNIDGSVFVNESFNIQVTSLISIYTSMFDLLKIRFPAMKTIVHGYDYPVHLDDPEKGMLGRHMIEKGITDPADRHTVIRFMLDEFNRQLQEVAQQYPDTVYYLDLRGTVLFRPGEIDQWHDEMHPNADGFQRIGQKYIKLVEQ